MEIKTIKPVLVLSSKLKSTIKDLVANVGDLPTKLAETVSTCGGQITGAAIWQYQSLTGEMDGEFAIDICLPVNKVLEAPEGYECTELPEYKCASMIHYGSWSELGKTYEKLVGEIMQKGIKHGMFSREIYLTCDWENPQNCVTEIQMQII